MITNSAGKALMMMMREDEKRERDDKREGESVCTYFQSPKAADDNPHLACGTTDL